MTWQDIGDGVRIEFVRDHVDRFTGLRIEHEGCEAQTIEFALPWVTREREQDVWNVHQWEPLTLHPSLLCDTCGLHGYIRNGKWVPGVEAGSRQMPLTGSEKLPVTMKIGGGDTLFLGEIEVRTNAVKASGSWTIEINVSDMKLQMAKILRQHAETLEAEAAKSGKD